MLKAVSKTDVEPEWEWAGVSDVVLMKHWLDSSPQPPAQLQAKVGGQALNVKLPFYVQEQQEGWKASSSARLYLCLFSVI